MSSGIPYPKRLIEVDLPIARISAHARREKSIRHGHISTLHIWWARRPLAACRAVICAALWPDPVDPNCPQAFRDAAARQIMDFARRADGDMKVLATSSEEGKARWAALVKSPMSDSPTHETELLTLRAALLDFIADFANWDNSTSQSYLETSRDLTQAAHVSLGGEPGTRPLVVDPFAGGGSIPLEALRVGADAFASDLNPVAVLLNKVVLEYIPKYGQRLADEIRKWGHSIKEQAEKELAEFYPKASDGATPIAYLWARTIQCEGPGCGAEVPLIRSFWLAKKANRSVALQLVPNPQAKRVDFQVIVKHGGKWVDQADPRSEIADPRFDGTVKRGSATCPCCGYTTPVARVREQLNSRHGGSDDATLTVVVWNCSGVAAYRAPTHSDLVAINKSLARTRVIASERLPSESTPENTSHRAVGSPFIYGMKRWQDLFTSRQLLTITTLVRLVRETDIGDTDAATATRTCLSLGLAKLADYCSTLTTWRIQRTCVRGTFGRQALGFTWDFGEMNPFADTAGDFEEGTEYVAKVVEAIATSLTVTGTAEQADATQQPFPDDAATALVTDPPYYDSVPYAEISDYFYVWLKRVVPVESSRLFSDELTPKTEQAIVWHPNAPQEAAEYVRKMTLAMESSRRAVMPSGVGVVFFAHKTTAGWEAQLASMIEAGWTITASWPLETERGGRFNSQDAASLASSVQLVCRPREYPDGSLRDTIGEWRDILQELPNRIHEWMPRLAQEGVVGADAIFACLGPALEIFSRYSRVEKASGEQATLREYLEYVWAAVSTEALSMIFEDADAAGLEPDARLTAMWLWTLGGGSGKAGANGNGQADEGDEAGEDADDDADEGKAAKVAGYVLEYDAARKIAQGLGIHLDKSESIVEVKGDKARLRPVSERTQRLFGKDAEAAPTGRGKKRTKQKQLTFFEDADEFQVAEAGWGELKGPPPGSTVLDRLHQAMILFAAGRGELLKRFLTEEGVGTDGRFWKLAQSFSALYPRGTDEKRWVDGVLARKKGLGL